MSEHRQISDAKKLPLVLRRLVFQFFHFITTCSISCIKVSIENFKVAPNYSDEKLIDLVLATESWWSEKPKKVQWISSKVDIRTHVSRQLEVWFRPLRSQTKTSDLQRRIRLKNISPRTLHQGPDSPSFQKHFFEYWNNSIFELRFLCNYRLDFFDWAIDQTFPTCRGTFDGKVI